MESARVVPLAQSEHAEGVCVSARALINSADEERARIERALEMLHDGCHEDAIGVLVGLVGDLAMEAAILAQFVESFDRRRTASATVRHGKTFE